MPRHGRIEHIEFGSRAEANRVRALLAPDQGGDRRTKTIAVDTSQVDQHTLERIVGMAADSRAHEAERVQDVPLSPTERRRLDFTETDVVTARRAKGHFVDAGVTGEQWLDFWTEDLTVDEAASLAPRASREIRGERMDTHEGEVNELARMAGAHHRVEGEQCDHAADHAATDEDARRFLLDECGWSTFEVENLLEPGPDVRTPATPAENRAVNIIRATAHGRFMDPPPDPAPEAPNTMRKRSTGRWVGNEFTDPGLGRDEQGRFVNVRDPEPVDPFASAFETVPVGDVSGEWDTGIAAELERAADWWE